MSLPGIKSLRQQNARGRRSRRMLGALMVLAVLFSVYCIAGFFVLPGIARDRLKSEAGALLGREVKIENVRLNPLAFSVSVEGLAVAGKHPGEPLLAWSLLYANLDLGSLWHREWRLEELRLEGLTSHSSLEPDGTLSFADVLTRLKGDNSGGSEAKDEGWPVRIAKLSVSSTGLRFFERTKTPIIEHHIDGFEFTVLNLTTAEGDASSGSLEAETIEGEKLSWRGGLTLDPLASNGRIELSNLSLAQVGAHLVNRLPFVVAEGRADASLNYSIASTPSGLAATVGEGRLQVANLSLADKGNPSTPVILKSLVVDGIAASTSTRRVELASAAITGATIELRKEPEGLNLTRWIPAGDGATPEKQAGQEAGWGVRIGGTTVEGTSVTYIESSSPRSAAIRIQDIQITAGALDTKTPGEAVPVVLKAAVAPGGTLSVDGKFALSPVQARAKVEVNGLALALANSALEAAAPLEVTKGTLTFLGEVSVAQGEGPLAIGASADLILRSLSLHPKGSEIPLFQVTELAARKLEFVSAPSPRLVVGEVDLTRPIANVVRDRSGALNASFNSKEESGSSTTPAAGAAPADGAASVAVDRLTLLEGMLVFTDLAVSPTVRVGVERLEGVISGLSSEQIARANVDLRAALEGASELMVKGQINPLSDEAFTDLVVSLKGFDLQPLSPYIGKYVGRELERGNAGLDLKVRVNKSELNSANVITFRPFTLGPATGSPDAVNLPVGLALSLLRDREGRIVLDVPVAGNLKDPEFKVGKVVWRVVGNLLARAATSPFSLLGSMFGGGGEELGYQDFSPGLTTLDEAGRRKLEVVRTALKERPSLGLEIVPSWDPAADPGALKARELQKTLLALLNEEARAVAPVGLDIPEILELSSEGEVRMLVRLAQRKGIELPPTGGVSDAALPPKSALEEAPLPTQATVQEKRSVWKRVADFFRPGSSDTRTASRSGSDASPRPVGPPAAAVPGSAEASRPTAPSAVSNVDIPALRARLIDNISLGEDALRRLAVERASAIRADLVGEGVEPDRVVIAPPAPEGTRVKLNLR